MKFKNITVRHFSDTLDEYGQTKMSGYTDEYVDMYISNRSTTNVDNPMFVDADYLGLTKCNSIIEGDEIIDGNNTYTVLYIIPTNRLNQIFMKNK